MDTQEKKAQLDHLDLSVHQDSPVLEVSLVLMEVLELQELKDSQ